MASPNAWSGGFSLAGTVFADGPPAALLKPAYLSGAVQFVDTISGSNGNTGADPELPVQTLAQAVTNSAANGLILIGKGSAETLASAQVVASAGIYIWGCGTGSARPRYTAAGAVDMFTMSGAGCSIRNIYFPASTVAPTSRIAFSTIAGEAKDCYFECGANDTNRAIRIFSSGQAIRIDGCTFLSTASRPAVGLELSAAVADITVVNTIFDGGAFGWTDFAFKISAAALRTHIEGVSMLRRSDFGVTSTGTSYKAFGLTSDGTNRTVFAA